MTASRAGCVLVAAALAVRTLAAAEPLVVAGKSAFTVCGDCDKPAARVPVTARGGLTTDKLQDIRVDSVETGARYVPDLAGQFQPTWQVDEKKRPIAILVATTRGAIAKPGAYDLLLAIESTDGERMTLNVTITRPAGQLDPPDTIRVDRAVWVPWTNLLSTSAPPLKLNETSRASSLTITAITQPKRAASGTNVVSGELAFTGLPAAVASGATAAVSYGLSGKFPLGVTTGTVQIQAPELAAPVPANFEVRSHLLSIYIVFCIAAGLAVSWWVKVRLQGEIDASAAEVLARRLLDQIAQIRQVHRDPRLADEVAVEEKNLAAAISSREAPEIEKARAALDTKFQAALQKLAGWRQPVQQALDAFRPITDNAWALPPTIGARRRAAADALASAVTALDVDDVKDAEATLRRVKSGLAGDLIPLVRTWRQETIECLNAIAAGPAGISMETKTSIAPDASGALALLTKVHFINAAADSGELLQLMKDLSDAWLTFKDLLERLAHAIQAETASAQALLRSVPLTEAAAVDQLGKASGAAADLVLEAIDQPATWQPEGLAALRELDTAWRNAVLNQLQQGNRPPIVALLDARQYHEAAEAAVKTLAGEPSAESKTVTEAPSRTFLVPGRPAVALALRSFSTVKAGPVVFGVSAARAFSARHELRLAKGKQTLAVGALLCLFGYTVYEPRFIGAFNECVTIFFWAFGLDMTVEALLRLTKK